MLFLAVTLLRTVRDVDTTWMRERLEAYLALLDDYDARSRSDRYFESEQEGVKARDAITQTAPTVQLIVNRLYTRGKAPTIPTPSSIVWREWGRDAANKALGILADRDEWKVRLAPDSPSLSADRLHPLIWEAARTVWDTGEFKTATQQAAVSLSAHIKARVGSHLNERELVQQVFSPDPPREERVRLHLPGKREDRNWRSAQEGLHLIAQGAFAGIRNIAVHGSEHWSEHEALEHLAVLSVVARWADQAEERTAEPTQEG